MNGCSMGSVKCWPNTSLLTVYAFFFEGWYFRKFRKLDGIRENLIMKSYGINKLTWLNLTIRENFEILAFVKI